ncbi:GMC family oxidoreductase [Candidatus Bathyarchaeota archaeon]|nr:GMC family oxidoreductase [Candidatus Bathyarchaeota archaeon]
MNPPNPEQGFNQSYQTWDEDAYSDGPLEIGFQGYVPETSVGFIEACEAVNIPIVDELNSGNGVGVQQGTGTIDSNFRRSSSYDAFYKPVSDRSNLVVLHSASVQRLITDTDGEKPKVTGVGFIYHPNGLVYEIKANKEVIVSMGAFNSPQLLMVSVRIFCLSLGESLLTNLSCRDLVPRLNSKSLGSSLSWSTRILVRSRLI